MGCFDHDAWNPRWYSSNDDATKGFANMSMMSVHFETYSILETTKMGFVILLVKMDHFLIVATEASPYPLILININMTLTLFWGKNTRTKAAKNGNDQLNDQLQIQFQRLQAEMTQLQRQLVTIQTNKVLEEDTDRYSIILKGQQRIIDTTKKE